MAGNITFDIFAKDHASAVFDKFGKSVDGSEKGMTRFQKRATVAGAVAGAALVKFAVSSVKAFAEADKSQRKLEDAYSRFPALADVNIKALRAQSAALQAKTGFDDDEINASQAVLAQYKLTGSQVEKLTPLLVDYAAKTGKDLPSASKTLGKALLGQGRALKDIGINFKDTGTTAGNLDELMAGLRTQVGGFADKEGKTAAGQAAILRQKFNDFEEDVGSKLVPTLTKLLDIANSVADWMKNNQTLAKNLTIVILALAAGFKTLAIANAAANTVAAANPYVRLATALAILAAAIVYAYKQSAAFRLIVHQMTTQVSNDLKFLVRAFFNVFLAPILIVFSAILHGAAIAFGWIPGIGDKLRNARDSFDKFKNQVNAIIDKITGKKTFVLDSHVSQATKDAFALYLNTPSSMVFTSYFKTVKLPGGTTAGFAAGGRPPVGVPSIVGERGPEMFVPDRAGTIVPNNKLGSSAGGVYISEVHVHGVQTTSELWQSLQKYAKRNGSIKLSGITA